MLEPHTTAALQGQVAVITGGAGGLGVAIAKALQASGAKIALIDLSAEKLDRAAESLGPDVLTLAADITEPEAVSRAFAAVSERLGPVKILVNNAGIAIRRPTLELVVDDWSKVIGVNLTGAFLCAKAAAAQMIPAGGGAIVNIASIMGLSGGGLYPNISYQTSKGGMVNMTRALAVEWAKSGIRVNAVAPTWVDTELIAQLKENPEFIAGVERLTPMGRLAQPSEVADAVVFLAGPGASMITGHTLPVDGGFMAQ